MEKELETIENFLFDFSEGGGRGSKMPDKMAISAFIFEQSRKGSIFKASNESKGYCQLMGFSRLHLKYNCTKV